MIDNYDDPEMNTQRNAALMAAVAYKPQGYHRLAGIMARDKSMAIFRRFDDLTMLNLLSLQAEIVDLQKHFRLQCELDENSIVGIEKEYSQYFLKLHKSDGDQLRKLREIGEKIQKYSESSDEISQNRQN